ncbi:MAG: hypothetical protein DMF96_15655 [Acidobacteria bacterium]|nr:MAG: hypothetical protein DMF96_15655 [Acidobacteriota bacterium]
MDLLAARPAIVVATAPSNGRRPYAELALRLFGRAPLPKVVAFAAANRAEGVTRTVRRLAAELARSGKTVACFDGTLGRPQLPGLRLPEVEMVTGQQDVAEVFAALRDRYDCVLLDCGGLDSSVDLLRLAPAADGIVLVVEAGRAGKEQINRAAQMITEAQGTLLGFAPSVRGCPVRSLRGRPGWPVRRYSFG